MGTVIQLPTQLNLKEEFKKGARVESAAVDGSVMFRVEGVEMWLDFEQAAELVAQLQDTVSDAFCQLAKEMEERRGRTD